MRFALYAATALALLSVPALAQTTTTTTPPATTPAPATAAPQTPAPSASTPAAPTKKYAGHRQTLQQRFEAANTAHDGHLTKDEATAAKWSYVTKHFAAMDTGNKGYVTVEEIHAYARAQHASHTKPATTPAPAQTNG